MARKRKRGHGFTRINTKEEKENKTTEDTENTELLSDIFSLFPSNICLVSGLSFVQERDRGQGS